MAMGWERHRFPPPPPKKKTKDSLRPSRASPFGFCCWTVCSYWLKTKPTIWRRHIRGFRYETKQKQKKSKSQRNVIEGGRLFFLSLFRFDDVMERLFSNHCGPLRLTGRTQTEERASYGRDALSICPAALVSQRASTNDGVDLNRDRKLGFEKRKTHTHTHTHTHTKQNERTERSSNEMATMETAFLFGRKKQTIPTMKPRPALRRYNQQYYR